MKPVRKTSKARKRPTDYEGPEQIAFMLWLKVHYPWAEEVCIHVPNGGSRNKIEAAKLKKQGVKAGFPDLVFFLPRGEYHGLAIEFKATPPNDADVQTNQKEWLQRLTDQGYKAVVARGYDEIRQVFKDYISEPAPHVRKAVA
ncbi:VRR-NUC domain-containing protein [Litoribrevibacter albus]|uniref:VRR-NUC domain-containing protein n=1 Tax=Litoribrevibacter albus TaxID=1473156 RepID=A0AA37W7V7_9GAMM|nr:VRR-NUC domain-containing protein [Litoribrevibacter albus]GLQ31634.1 hypothetical protein GCM10007876_21130 [Litoribrevibacter albus]